MPSSKYPFPAFLGSQCSAEAYNRWLGRKASAHVRRDRARGYTPSREAYKRAIHAAVVNSRGRDAYTGMPLSWNLISTFDNDKAKLGRRVYKKTFGNLPTVDHLGDGSGKPDFVICSWRTNDCKNDLSQTEFVEFCRSVLKYTAKVRQRSVKRSS